MDTKKLRQKILDLAIRGKLVPQDPSDEPASLLLERIRAEKERLIKEGKIKRSKKAAADEEIEAPFEIPESWEWCILPDLCSIPITDGTHQTPTYSDRDHGVPFISSKDVTSQRINWENIKFITKDLHESLYKRVAPQRDDILLAKNGTTGVAAIVEDDSVFDIYVTLAVIRPIKELVLPVYLWRVINCDFCKKQFDDHLTGIGLPNLHLTDIKKTIIPLPPYQEQLRIANEVERWFAVIDALESNEGDLLKAIDQAKSKILDLAIHGKLVPQDPNDEPAIDLLKRINPKFEACGNEDCPFEIPESWWWCKLKDLCSFLSRGKSPIYSDERKYPVFAQKCNLYDGDISLEQARFLDPSTLSKWPEKYKLRDGDVLVNSTGTGTVGRTRLFHSDCLGEYPFVVPDSHISVVRTVDNIDSYYIYSIMSSKYGQNYIEDNLAGSTNQKELYIGVLENALIPLPPYQEQLRIVAKIEELFGVLDGIKETLEA